MSCPAPSHPKCSVAASGTPCSGIATAHADARVVAFSHGAAIGEVLAQATGSRPFAFLMSDNTAIARLVLTPESWVLRGFNDTAHLHPWPA